MISRREREKEERRKYILEKAQSLFANKGYLGTSMAQIAEASEFAVGSLYSFFKSKEEILGTIFEYHIDHVLSQVRAIRNDETMSSYRKIEKCIETLVQIYINNLDFFRIYIAEARGIEWGVRTEVGEFIYHGSEQYMKIFSEIFEDAIEKGTVDTSFDPAFLSHLVRSFIHTTVVHFMYSSQGVTVDQLVETVKRMLFKGIQPIDTHAVEYEDPDLFTESG